MKKYTHDRIPGPKPYFLLGNVPDVLPDFLGTLNKLHKKHGSAVQLSIGEYVFISVNDPEILKTVLAENEYFTKEVKSAYSDLAIVNGRGLVTTATRDADWQLGHKLIMNAFSARAMNAYHYSMGKSITELCDIFGTFAKTGKDLDVRRWFSAFALESIGKIGFAYEFDLLKDPDAPRHPFIVALTYVQSIITKRYFTPSWLKWYHTSTNMRFHRDLQTLRNTVDDVLKDRHKHPHPKDNQTDLLDFMIYAKSKEGEKMNDTLIRDNIITLLIAGHNTTSVFLSWTILELCRHPEVAENIKQEIANCGIKAGQIPTPEQVKECKYLDLVIKESLRMHPPLTPIFKYCKKDAIVKASNGNEYEIKADQLILVNIYALHHNPDVWENPNVFNPNRFAGGREYHPNAWMAFSDGPRACIGRQFALLEGKLALIMMLSRFNFKMENPNQEIDYEIVITTNPVGLLVKVEDSQLPEPTEEILITKRREGNAVSQENVKSAQFPLPSVTFLFGTQTGTSEEYARKLSVQAKEFGFQDIKVQDLDDWKLIKGEVISTINKGANAPSGEDNVKVSELVVVVTATYNGFPPDNANEFSKWLEYNIKNAEATKEDILSGILYAVFGCGNRDWDSTFQKFPKKVDDGFELLGGERLLPAGQGDASEDIDGEFSVWSAAFWASLMQRYGQSAFGKNADIMIINNGPEADPSNDFTLEFIDAVKDRSKAEQAKLNHNQLEGSVVTVVENRELQSVDKSQRSTKHIEVQFEKSVDGKPLYEAGDYLEVIPVNEDKVVEIIATNLGLVLDSVFEIKDLEIKNLSSRSVAANIKGPCTIRNALKYYADLTGPPTRFTLTILSRQLADTRPDIAESIQKALQSKKESPQLKNFLTTHRTLIDIIQVFKIKELNFKEFISSVNCIAPRKYSISSSPLKHPFDPSISVGVVEALSGIDETIHYFGLGSGYLSRQNPGCKINAQIKSCKSTFRLPANSSIPVILIAAGTGFSPFRGFLQERHAKGLKSSNKNYNGEGSACYMFFGCRHPDQDFIYKEEVDAYVNDGTITELYTTYSRSGDTFKYVQHALLKHANILYTLVEKLDAKVYVCGSAKNMAKDVKRTWERILVQMSGMPESEAANQIQTWIEQGKYNEDVWGT